MGDLIATTGTNVKGLGTSSNGPRSVAKPKVAIVIKVEPMTEEQKNTCKRKQIEAAQYAEMGITPSCGRK